jgi:hypothetical protein
LNFKTIFKDILRFFEKASIPHALIGAFALKAYGYVRATGDIDFIVDAAAQEKIIPYLESLGYETLYLSAGFSNHLHPVAGLGRIDFVYVTGETSTKFFQEARLIPVFGDQRCPVAAPEHLAALKIYAMKNNPERTFREMADLAFLISLPGIDMEAIKACFQKYDQMDKFDELLKKNGQQ